MNCLTLIEHRSALKMQVKTSEIHIDAAYSSDLVITHIGLSMDKSRRIFINLDTSLQKRRIIRFCHIKDHRLIRNARHQYPYIHTPLGCQTQRTLHLIAATADASLSPYFSISLQAILDTLSAVALAFILGLCLSSMRGKQIGNSLYNGMAEFSKIIDKVLHTVIIPLLPLYICGTFVDMTKSGKTFAILSILWKVFLVVIVMHLICILIQFVIAGTVSKKNPFELIKNQVPGYTTALGTQSSAATIPVNLECAKNDGVCEQIRNFVVPLCANIHMAGSMITITACATAVCLMNQLPISLGTVIPFIMTLGVAMVASPGAPGGSIMTALPFLYMIFGAEAGDPDGAICAIMVALYITQDSFGTACNVSGDNAIGVIVNTIYERFIKKEA